jgi:hypothetical protein
MTVDGTCERGGVQRAPQEIEERSPALLATTRKMVLLYGGVLWSGGLRGFILHEMVPPPPDARWVVVLSSRFRFRRERVKERRAPRGFGRYCGAVPASSGRTACAALRPAGGLSAARRPPLAILLPPHTGPRVPRSFAAPTWPWSFSRKNEL